MRTHAIDPRASPAASVCPRAPARWARQQDAERRAKAKAQHLAASKAAKRRCLRNSGMQRNGMACA